MSLQLHGTFSRSSFSCSEPASDLLGVSHLLLARAARSQKMLLARALRARNLFRALARNAAGAAKTHQSLVSGTEEFSMGI